MRIAKPMWFNPPTLCESIMKKVKFTKKGGEISYLEVDQSLLKNKILSLSVDNNLYSLQSLLNDPILFSVARVNYQKFNYNDGGFEYREM